MKDGDLVRFRRGVRSSVIATGDDWNIGLLVEYHTWAKVATILHEGKVYRVRAENVQKAGRKDFE